MTNKEHEHHLYDLDDLDDIEENPALKLIKKILVLGIGAFMVLLMLTYIVPIDIFTSLVASDTIDQDFSVSLRSGGRVIFTDGVYQELREIYFDNPETEFKVCLIGDKVGDDYWISSIYLPKTFLKTFASVRSEQCSPDTIIPLHKHPFRSCIFSEQDLKSYEAFKEVNPEAIIGLICEEGRFTFHGTRGSAC